MNRIVRTLCVLLTASAVLTSCLGGDDDQVTTYSDMAITAITLGTLNRYTQTTSSNTGNDTIIKSTLTGSNYRLTIDQLGRRIYNQDSLPVGTDLEHVVISSLSTKNSGLVYLKSLTSDSLRYLSTSDSIDFSQPRILRVFATDGSGSRDYIMTLGASKTTGTTFGWKKVATRDDLKGWTDKQLVACADTVLLVDRGTIVVNGTDIIAQTPNMQGISQLIGATAHEIFALGDDGRLKVATDGIGQEWRDERLDEDASLLPTTGLAMTSWPYTPADSTDYVLLAGYRDAAATYTTLWRKLSPYSRQENQNACQWVYMPIDGSNRYALPRQDGLSLVYYEGSVLAVGNQLNMLQSRDQGITWKTSSVYTLPTGMEGTSVAMAADRQGRLWLVTNAGQVWTGALR